MTTWQPIETAPRDDMARYLVWRKDWKYPEKGFWRKSDSRFGWFGSWGIKHEKNNQPTHWQPLPAPPNA